MVPDGWGAAEFLPRTLLRAGAWLLVRSSVIGSVGAARSPLQLVAMRCQALTPEFHPMEFARIAEALEAAPTPAHTAVEVVDYVRDQLDADHCGITLIRPGGRLETIAATGDLVDQVDSLQYELDEGPCRDATWRGQTLVVSTLATDDRWPLWAPKAAALGITSVLSVELASVEDRRLGSINTYWMQRRMITADDIAFANILARHAALALSRSLNEAGLNLALDSRKRIGQAQGILMERYGLGEDRAFEVLRRYSQDHNIKLRQVAEYLISARELPTSRPDDPRPG
jgi:hypothetical protein